METAEFYNYATTVLTYLERRDIFLAAVFLWITPFLAARSIMDVTVLILPVAFSKDVSFEIRRISLTSFFTLVFTALLRIRRFSFCRVRFNADL